MSRYGGRDVIVNIGGVPVAVVREKTLTHNKEAVDVTADEDNGWRRLLPIAGTRSIDASVSGVCDDVNIPQLQNLWVMMCLPM
jgi:predicted secreted protein